MKTKKPTVAICYDFDGTLSPRNMQEYGFFPGLTPEDQKSFWQQAVDMAKMNRANPILAYMRLMLEKAKDSKGQTKSPLKTTRKAIKDYGKSIQLFPGVETWFKRIHEHGKKLGIQVEHYIISSGLVEMIEGSPIFKEFTKVYACSFIYDNNDAAEWPAQVVDSTSKTQYLFRISKGALDLSDDKTLNAPIKDEDRHIAFSHMIYIGDGFTDIPSMTVVQERGGHSIAVYEANNRKKQKEASTLFRDGRVHFCLPADYQKEGPLETTVFAILDKIFADYCLNCLSHGKKVPKLKKSNDPQAKMCAPNEAAPPSASEVPQAMLESDLSATATQP